MLMKELKEKELISSRLYNYLCFAFRDTVNNRKEYLKMIRDCEALSFGKRNEVAFAYFDKMDQKFADSSLEEVLSELKVSEPEDIMQFRNLGKKSVSELRALIERDKNDSKAI